MKNRSVKDRLYGDHPRLMAIGLPLVYLAFVLLCGILGNTISRLFLFVEWCFVLLTVVNTLTIITYRSKKAKADQAQEAADRALAEKRQSTKQWLKKADSESYRELAQFGVFSPESGMRLTVKDASDDQLDELARYVESTVRLVGYLALPDLSKESKEPLRVQLFRNAQACAQQLQAIKKFERLNELGPESAAIEIAALYTLGKEPLD